MEVKSRVICVDDTYVEGTAEELKADCPSWVKKGQKYHIRQINDLDYVVSVLLEEVVNPLKYFRLTNDVREPAFKISRFRELQEDEVSAEKIEQENLIEV
jgi:hypothetical protein